MFSRVTPPHASTATTAIETPAKRNTNWWPIIQWEEDGDMDKANMVAKPTGPLKRPKLSAMLNIPLSLPRMAEHTRVVDEVAKARLTWPRAETETRMDAMDFENSGRVTVGL